jgi:putative MFS transporter
MSIVAGSIMVPAALSMVLVAFFGRETRGSDLRDLEPVQKLREA